MWRFITLFAVIFLSQSLWAQADTSLSASDTTLPVPPADSLDPVDSALVSSLDSLDIPPADTVGNDTLIAYGKENKDTITTSTRSDSAFAQARRLAYDEKFKEASAILENYLIEKYPENYDYKYFLARIKSWDGRYNEARTILNRIIFTNEDTVIVEAYRLMGQVERYDEKYDTAIGISNFGLKHAPGDEFFLVNKAQSQTAQIDYREALNTVDTALQVHPENEELQKLKQFLLNQLFIEGLAVGAGLDYFTAVNSPWLSAMVQYGKFLDFGALIGRVNYANRFDQNGYQFEIDAYPQLGKGRYFYLNAGWSPSEIFPDWRFGAEYYSRIPTTNLEASLGLRYLIFGEGLSVTTITGSLGWYFGDNFLQFRPYFTNQNTGFATTYNLLYRHFMGGMGDYFQFNAGVGFTPDTRLIQLGGVVGREFYNLDTRYLGFAYQKILSDEFYARADLTFTHQEQFNNPENFYTIISVFITLGIRI